MEVLKIVKYFKVSIIYPKLYWKEGTKSTSKFASPESPAKVSLRQSIHYMN